MPESDVVARLEVRPPSPALAEQARTLLGECPSTRASSLSDLREIIYERGECTPHRMDDEFLLRFLRARHFVPERAHRLLVNYYHFKEENPELFENVYPLQMRHVGESGVLSVPPYHDKAGRRLMMYRIGSWNPNEYPLDDLMRATVIVLELGVLEPRAQILGGVAIFDLEGIGMQHVWQVTPGVASKIVQLIASSFPLTTHAVHIINGGWMFDKMFSLFKPLLHPYMRKRIEIHSNLASLHKHVDLDCLPERYGGTRQEYPYTMWLDGLKKDVAIIREMETVGYKIAPEDRPPGMDDETKILEDQATSKKN